MTVSTVITGEELEEGWVGIKYLRYLRDWSRKFVTVRYLLTYFLTC